MTENLLKTDASHIQVHSNHGRLEGKVCVITGASAGIGREAAKRFASEGALVACLDRGSSNSIAQEIRDNGGHAVGIDVDVTDLAAMERAAQEVLGEWEKIDVVWANAGIAGVGSVGSVTPEHWHQVLAVDLTGVWITMRTFLPSMVDRGQGSIIATASVSAFVGFEESAPYSAAKGGVVALVQQAAVDYGSRGIRVNAIAPGMVPTGLLDETIARRGGAAGVTGLGRDQVVSSVAKLTALGHVGEPIDIANLGLFLASDESRWITGRTMVIDGGMSIR